MPDKPFVLIAAISGRALAQSAQRASYQPLVVDFFGDQDTLEVARDHVRLTGALANGISESALLSATEAIAARYQPIGIVCGTGFEDRPHLLQALAERWRLLGNGAEIVRKVKSPEFLSAICGELAIAFPEFSFTRPNNPADWLAKRVGGAGGSHIRPASQSTSHTIYYQRKVSGVPVSVLFLANGSRSVVMGFSAQWLLPTPTRPYRYGGAVRPATIAGSMVASLTSAVAQLTNRASLVGLNSVDFYVDGERFWLLDINPRPGATLDIFEPPRQSLFGLHIAACAGKLVTAAIYPPGAKAAAIAYAESDIPSMPALEWPNWTADRPQPGIAVKAGEPLCTVYACDTDAAVAKALTEERRRLVLAWMGAR